MWAPTCHAFSKQCNRPRSICQYSKTAPTLSGQTSIFGVVFFVSKSLLGIERQQKLKKFTIFTRKPRSHVRIFIYRTSLIDPLTEMAFLSRDKCRFLLLILCSISHHVRSSEKTYPGAIYTKLNSRLRGYAFKSHITPSQVSCSQACLFNIRCSSTNFKEISQQHQGLCELNDAPSFDVISLENDLHHEDGFIFALFPNDNMVRQY